SCLSCRSLRRVLDHPTCLHNGCWFIEPEQDRPRERSSWLLGAPVVKLEFREERNCDEGRWGCRSWHQLTRIEKSPAAGPLPPRPARNGTPAQGRWGIELTRSAFENYRSRSSTPPAAEETGLRSRTMGCGDLRTS